MCTTKEEIECTKALKISTTSCIRLCYMLLRNIDIHIIPSPLTVDFFSPCSGLVSGYSKVAFGEHIQRLQTYLNHTVNPYKKFKKMYFVDNSTDEFKGQRREHFFILLSTTHTF